MILIQCNTCENEFELQSVKTMLGKMFVTISFNTKIPVCCVRCGSGDVSRILTPANEGTPSIGKHSATSAANRKR